MPNMALASKLGVGFICNDRLWGALTSEVWVDKYLGFTKAGDGHKSNY